jgi:hypothetical protein
MSHMTKCRVKKSELERVAERGWMFTFRYMLLLQALKPSTRLGRWAMTAGTAVGTIIMAIVAARGNR